MELALSSLQGHEGVYELDENLRAPTRGRTPTFPFNDEGAADRRTLPDNRELGLAIFFLLYSSIYSGSEFMKNVIFNLFKKTEFW